MYLIEFYSMALNKRVSNWFASYKGLPDAIIKDVKNDKVEV